MIVADPGAKLEFVHVRVPTVQIHVPPGPVRVWAVVFGGSVSVRLTPVAVLGPLLVTTCVYVIVPPGSTGTGLGEFVTERSAVSATKVVTVALLFVLLGSLLEATEAVCERIVPLATVDGTFTTNVKLAVPTGMAAVSVQVRLASTQFQPAGPASDTAVVPDGRVSVRTAAFAEPCPALVIVCV